MKFPTTRTWLFLVGLLAVYWLLPAMGMRFLDPQEASFAFPFLLLLFVLPGITGTLALVDSLRDGFSIAWLLGPTLAFATTVFVYYNESALFYCGCYAIAGGLGSLLGHLLRRR